jgi:hypothetical protein
MPISTPGDALHSTLTPDRGDWQGDRNLADGSFWGDPLGALTSAAHRATSYGNWAGPGNRFEGDILRKKAADPGYDPARDPAYGRGTAVDGLDAAARDHDFAYYRDNTNWGAGSPTTPSMFSLEGLENTRNADRKLQQDAAREMAHPSAGKDGRPVTYSADSRNYADTMQGFFGGRADGVDLRHDYQSGKTDALGVAGTAVSEVGRAYEHNGLRGALGETAGLANVAVASAYDWLTK